MARKSLTGFDANNKAIVNLADGSAATDAVTLQQLQAVQRGIDWKDSVRAASTANITIASALINGATMDGVTLATGNRVLLKDQTAGAENGIYVVVASGAASRAVDADTSAEVTAGMAVTVEEGTANGDKIWQLTTNNPITLGTTSLTFSPLGGSGVTQAYQTVQNSGSGLTQRSILNFATGLTAVDNAGSSRTDVSLDTTLVTRKFAADCAATTNPQTFTHNLNTLDVMVQVRIASSGEHVEADVTSVTVNTISVNFGGAPTAAQYRVLVLG